MTEPLNHHEALFYVMVASSAVDRAMTDDEFARIGEMVSNLPVFADCDEEGLVKAAEACGKILSADDGLQQVVRLVREALPEKLRETAYCVACTRPRPMLLPELASGRTGISFAGCDRHSRLPRCARV